MNNYNLDDLLYLMERLRAPEDGCPWDLAQSYETIVPSTIEEAYEVADAIERGDINSLREELGDLIFQAVFYSQLAKEEGRFTLLEVISGLVDKLVRRHPHVFPEGTLNSRKGNNLNSSSEVKQQWEEIKSNERAKKGQHSLMDDVPLAFPALLRAHKLQKRAARVGFDWPEDQGVFDKLQEEIAEVEEAIADKKNTAGIGEGSTIEGNSAIEEELGDLLFTCVNLTRRLGYDSETALRKASHKFEQRFRNMEQQASGKGLEEMTSSELEQLWVEAKSKLK